MNYIQIEAKVWETKKNPRRKYYKYLCEFINSLKITIQVG